jgi:hypothetical protein
MTTAADPGARPQLLASRSQRSARRIVPAAIADRLLELALAGFAAWTLIYHLCTVAGVGSHVAFAAWVVALVPCVLFVLWRGRGGAGAEPGAPVAEAARRSRRVRWPTGRAQRVLAANLVGALAAGVLFAFTGAPWALIWALWVIAAGCSVAWSTLRVRNEPPTDADEAVAPAGSSRRDWGEAAVVAAWALGLAFFSLFILTTDRDDTYYVHFAAWVSAHGQFPTRDVLFSNNVFPAIYYPPVNSWEAFTGTLSDVAGVRVPTAVYLGATPAGAILGVLAVWRLLRAWRVRMVALAISVAMVFLCFDASGGQTIGAFFIGRLWQGKVVFVVAMVPLLVALLHEYAARPSRRGLTLLALGGVAAVGLTTTATFVVPLMAIGYLLPVFFRERRVALQGAVALATYPVAAALVTRGLGGRTPDVYTDKDMVPQDLVHRVMAFDTLALVSVLAFLVGPVLIRRKSAALMVASATLLVGILYAPGLPLAIFHATGLGRVLWRLTWAMPTAALVGVLATAAVPRAWPALARLAPAVAVCIAVILAGTPIWDRPGDSIVASQPVYKRLQDQTQDARDILRMSHRGDIIAAPFGLSQTIGIFSGDVTTVDPADFYVHGVNDVAKAHAPSRRVIGKLIRSLTPTQVHDHAPDFHQALLKVNPDLVCIRRVSTRVRAALTYFGYKPVGETERYICLRPGRRS